MEKYQRKDQQRNEILQVVDIGTYGKVPPQAREAEKAVLGAILLQKEAFTIAAELLIPSCFYEFRHQKIFSAFTALSNNSQPIDYLTVKQVLINQDLISEIGGEFYLSELTNNVVSSAHIEAHSRIIYQCYLQREIIKTGLTLVGEGYEDGIDIFELLDKTEKHLYSVTSKIHSKDYQRASDIYIQSIIRLEKIRHNQNQLSGIPSGFKDLDRITHGWQDTDLIILAARPSVGKTALALNLARNAAMSSNPRTVLFFSLEMSTGQLMQRLISAESEISLERIRKGRMEDSDMQKLHEACAMRIGNSPLFIDDTAALNIFELRAKCRRAKARHNLGMIIIDYLQLMSGLNDNRNSNREQDISNISRALKQLAKELEVPIIALSQLSRKVEDRTGNIPKLSDLRESGAIEQDADMVLFLYEGDHTGQRKVKVAKNRQGELETINLTANLWIQKFVDYEPPPFGESTKEEKKETKKRNLPSKSYIQSRAELEKDENLDQSIKGTKN